MSFLIFLFKNIGFSLHITEHVISCNLSLRVCGSVCVTESAREKERREEG